MKESTDVRLVITSAALTAAELEARLALKPDEAWKAGDRRGSFGNVEKLHGFIVESGAPLGGFADQLRALIKRLAPCAVKLGELAPQVRAQVQCRLVRKTVPVLDFERDELRWLASMGCGLEVDITLDAPKPVPAKPAAPSDGQR